MIFCLTGWKCSTDTTDAIDLARAWEKEPKHVSDLHQRTGFNLIASKIRTTNPMAQINGVH